MRHMLLRSLLAMSLSIGISACTPGDLTGPGTPDLQGQSDLVANNSAGFAGSVRIPSELVANNSAGLVANNSAGLVANNSAGYRVAALAEEPLANALIYLLNPNEQFYRDPKGERIVTSTDAQGAYRLDAILPAKKPVIVSAMLSGNRRMVGYTYTQAGENRVDVSVASTYVTEFFRAQAGKAGRTMADYPEALAKLPQLVTETQKLLDAGQLPIPDLTLGGAARMNQVYLSVFGSRSQALSDLWAEMLGRRLIALSTAAGTYALGVLQEDGPATGIGLHLPSGVAADVQGNLFIAEQNHHGLRWVKPDGSSTFIGGFRGDGSVSVPTRSGDGASFAESVLPQVLDVACDPDGNVIASLLGGDGKNDVLVFLCRKTGTYFGKAMQAGHSYMLGEPSGAFGNDDGPIHVARFKSIAGVTSDDAGNLYLADRRNNLIRRVDRGTGVVTTVAGFRSFDEDGVTVVPAEKLATYATVLQEAREAVIHRPFDVAWKRGADGRDRLYVWEGTNPTESDPAVKALGNAIREIAFDPATPEQGTIRFLMGGPGKRGLGGDGGPAAEAQLNLVDPAFPDVPNGGIAVSKDGRKLYFADSANRRLRVIDLESGRVETAAGGGNQEGDSEARDSVLKDVSGPATGPNGEVYFCDTWNHVVRKLNGQFGL
ncbi:NHL repeat protein [compost metagenome]